MARIATGASGLIVALLVLAATAFAWPRDDEPGLVAERRAVEFLATEVPLWSRENACFSCHNDGDGARALFVAARTPGLEVPDEALQGSLNWLLKPGEWGREAEDDPSRYPRLARVQFTAALSEAIGSGRINDRTILLEAAERLAADAADDGSWPIEGDGRGLLGSPATYGGPLATAIAVGALRKIDANRHADAIARAERFLLDHPIRSTLDAAALLMTLGHARNDERDRPATMLLVDGAAEAGGWGPFPGASPEPFDTALALLALAKRASEPEVRARIVSGRAYLIATQLPGGNWAETTRPRGGQSYAQRVSTTAWALLALLATREPPG